MSLTQPQQPAPTSNLIQSAASREADDDDTSESSSVQFGKGGSRFIKKRPSVAEAHLSDVDVKKESSSTVQGIF